MLHSICADNVTGDLHQIFDTMTVSVWHSIPYDDDWHVRQEALKVLGLIISHSMLALLLLHSVCAHSGTGDLCQQMFDNEIVMWRSMLNDDDWHVRHEALNVLGLATSHSNMVPCCVGACAHSGTGHLR